MSFQDFIKLGQIKRVEIDKELAKSLLKTTKSDLIFFDSWQIDENSARKIVSNYYDALRSILEAISALEGYKIYSHEVFTDFLKEKNENLMAEKFDRFRRIRNKINYYGSNISIEEAKEYKEGIIEAINILINKYLLNL